MAELRKKVNPSQLPLATRLASKAIYDGIKTKDFIINASDGYAGGIVRKQPHITWDNPGDPHPDAYRVTLEGDTGDVIEFCEMADASRDEIGTGTFAVGSTVYGTIGSDLKVVITDVKTTGKAILGTVEIPLATDADGNKFVWVRLNKSGAGAFSLAST
jgi:hypothetical protein